VFDVLRRELLFLSAKKMQFFAQEMSILGHIVDEKRIKMDLNKVDSVTKWKTPTSKDQLASYLGALGYLAPNCEGIRIPMALLSKRARGSEPFQWGGSEDRAFRQTQEIVEKFQEHHRVALKYEESAGPINLVADASLTGASGFLSQGEDWRKAPIAAFWSGMFNTTQQNYSVSNREALAIVSSLRKFQTLLHGKDVVREPSTPGSRVLRVFFLAKTRNAREGTSARMAFLRRILGENPAKTGI
jgi:hypothetical protein